MPTDPPAPTDSRSKDAKAKKAAFPGAAPLGRPTWKTGDNCLGKYWEDNQFYPVNITGVTNTTAVVLFSEFGNFEEVLITDLIPFPGGDQGGKKGRSNIAPTPGLPPAFGN